MSEAASPSQERKLLFIAVGVFLVILAGMFFWKEFSLFRLERKIERELEAERAELAHYESRLRDSAVAQATQMLDLFSVPLAWAVRVEAIKGDQDQIEEYMLQLIKQPSVKGAAFVGSDGRIQLATDRKLQGADATAQFGDLIAPDETVLREVSNELRLMIPIRGVNERLGSFVVLFSRSALLPTERTEGDIPRQ